MQALKITIPGEYWDTQLYEGRLYLFRRDGSLATINWDRLITDWGIAPSLRLALEVAFRQSDYLYSRRFDLFLNDDQIKRVLLRKFQRLASQRLEVSDRRLKRALISEQQNPFPFPHADSAIYNRRMYVGGPTGVLGAGANKNTKYGVSTRARRLFDAPTLAIAPSYGALAVAAGEDGLFSVPMYADVAFGDSEAPLISSHCSSCSWAYYSIHGSSHLVGGKLAAFRKGIADYWGDDPNAFRESVEEVGPVAPSLSARLSKPPIGAWGTFVGRPSRRRQERYVVRQFERLVDDEEIFDRVKGFSWASQDKICLALDGRIAVVRYSPWEEDSTLRLEPLGSLVLEGSNVGVTSGAVALFGTIVEFEDSLVIVRSDGSSMTIPEEPVKWRVFPRSKHYENQLHVVFEDRLEIYSFNHDYFVDQQSKISGTRAWIS